MVYSLPWSRDTPLMRITSVPAPLMSAPMLFRKLAKSTTCGSLAAFSMVVFPAAIVAAIITLMVAPTETTSKYIWFPFNSSVSVIISPCSILTLAPKALKPLICWSIGRKPILQPPGRDTSAFLYFPSKAPSR